MPVKRVFYHFSGFFHRCKTLFTGTFLEIFTLNVNMKLKLKSMLEVKVNVNVKNLKVKLGSILGLSLSLRKKESLNSEL